MNEKRIITIFSTKSVQVEKGLFDKNAKVVDRAKMGGILESYFSRTINVNNMLKSMVESDEGKKVLRTMFQNKIDQVKGGEGKPDADAIKRLVGMKTPNDIEYGKKVANAAVDEKVEKLFSLNIEKELENPSDMDLLRRVEKWDLRDEVIKLNEDSEEWKKVLRKSTMYQIGESDVYALHCLEEEDMDREKERWLPCLLKCAKALMGDCPETGVRIQLVMHDAEFGRGTEYAKHDMMLLETKADVERDENFPVVKGMLGENDECGILFFQHTVNSVTRILNTPVAAKEGDSVHKKVKEVMDMYGELGRIKKNSKEAQSLEACIEADEQLRLIQDKLK